MERMQNVKMDEYRTKKKVNKKERKKRKEEVGGVQLENRQKKYDQTKEKKKVP